MDRILSANISSFSNFLKFYHYNICHFGLAKPNWWAFKLGETAVLGMQVVFFCSAFSIGFCEFWCLFDWFRNAPFKWCSFFNFCFNTWLLHPLGLDGFPNATTLLSRFFYVFFCNKSSSLWGETFVAGKYCEFLRCSEIKKLVKLK